MSFNFSDVVYLDFDSIPVRSSSRHVFLTKNMYFVLHHILDSIVFIDGEISFNNSPYLSSLRIEDILDCYSRLGFSTIDIDHSLLLCSRKYVFNKYKHLNDLKYRRRFKYGHKLQVI